MKREILISAGVILSVLLLGVFVMAVDTAPTEATVTVNEWLSVTVDDTTLAFGSLDPLATATPTGDPLVATIGAESNVDAKVQTIANATDFECISGGCTIGTDKFAVSYLEWDDAGAFPGTNYSSTIQGDVCASVTPGNVCNVYHRLTIPGGTIAGSYSVGITITATTAV